MILIFIMYQEWFFAWVPLHSFAYTSVNCGVVFTIHPHLAAKLKKE